MNEAVLSICTGMGLLDRAFLDAGFPVTAGCEIDPDQRLLHRQLCGGEPLCHDLRELLALLRETPRRFTGIIGGPPCQAWSRLRAIRKPKFPDLTPLVVELLEVVRPEWFLFENVAPVRVPGASFVRLNAMHYGKPHQSRARWFSYATGLVPPAPLYRGSVDDLLAYSIVAGRIYGKRRAAVLQGYPAAADLEAPPLVIVKGLANAVHYGLGGAWAQAIRQSRETRQWEPGHQLDLFAEEVPCRP